MGSALAVTALHLTIVFRASLTQAGPFAFDTFHATPGNKKPPGDRAAVQDKFKHDVYILCRKGAGFCRRHWNFWPIGQQLEIRNFWPIQNPFAERVIGSIRREDLMF
jgi:hypothetical protein